MTVGCVGELVVAEHAGRSGIARSLVAAAEAWARDQGLAHLTLRTGAYNAAPAPATRPWASPRRKSAAPARSRPPERWPGALIAVSASPMDPLAAGRGNNVETLH
jgi:GNAT superfamily N-acetyltransferase